MRFQRLSFILILIFLFSSFAPCFAAEDSLYVWSNQAESISNQTVSTSTTLTDATPNFTLESGSAILIEQTTGQILYAHNEHEALRPASVTKLMSILLIMEALDSNTITLDTLIPCSEKAAGMGGSQIWLDTRETLSVHDMLKAICVVSANDCTVAMAEYLAGSEEAFVQQMNEKAQKLGMKDTTFKNCHGIDEDGHVTSSYDLALLSRELLNNHPSITNYTTIWMDSLRDGKSELVNTNKLIRNYQGATGLKTGSTSLAQYNLAASATRNGLSLIAIIMKAPSTKVRFQEAEQLLNYGFNNYESKSLGKAQDVLAEIPVEKGINSSVKAVLKEDKNILLQKGKTGEITQSVFLPERLTAPVQKDDKLGEVIYLLDGTEIARSDLIASETIEKNTWQNICNHIFSSWCSLLRI